ncbi:uncharacterized protein LOC125765157 [Anopheles funestus]|uniref:uncharacterized protein LOC125765157 n=1 Tax=Anopheles funestus TaxID=62324 RepID=UPI0020C743C5|nr:uncharacterized protein LOC125765157 [Anopheles funestus]
MARFQLLRLLVVLFGAGPFSSILAALATNDEHLLMEQNAHRHHAYQKDSQSHSKASYPTSATNVPSYELEHGQTEAAAREYVASMTDAELSVPSWCKECNATMLHYCRTQRFLNDHCCCEYSHAREQLPWISHTCHRQLEGDCKVNAGSCGKYRVIKECCCDRITKLESKNKYSSGSNTGPARFIPFLALACAFVRFVPQQQLS